MAEAILNALAEDAGLGLRAESAGVAALEGADMDSGARAALEEMGIYAGDHRARQVIRSLVEEADLVLTMSPRQSAKLLESFDVSPDKVHTLPAYSYGASSREGIVDPHGQSMQTYRAASRVIAEHVSSLVDRAASGALPH
jgi:protein-tyrosine-phosphatase